MLKLKFTQLENKIPNTSCFSKKDRVPTSREQNIKYCEFIKEIELTSLEKETQRTTGFLNRNTMTDILKKRKMK